MMKTRNKVIVTLSILGIVLFGLVQGVVIPRNNEKKQQYILEQQNPISHDLDSILKYKSKYMGNISNVAGLFNTLPLNNIRKSFELFSDKLIAQVNYKDTIEDIGEDKISKVLIYNCTAAFALIDNLQGINYSFPGTNYTILRSDVEKLYGGDLRGLLRKDEWKSKVQDKLLDSEYVNNFTSMVLKR
jgi:hypothetical protein